MNKQETTKILSILRAAYPNFYKGMTKADISDIINLWLDMFADEPYAIVASACKALIASQVDSYPPTIGMVKDYIQKLTAPKGELSEQEAWAIVSSKLSNCIYNSKEQFNSLPEVIKQVVGSSSQLYEWALMDKSTLQSVVASNFMRSYKARASAFREYQKLPQAVKDFSKQITAKMKSLDSNEIEVTDEQKQNALNLLDNL